MVTQASSFYSNALSVVTVPVDSGSPPAAVYSNADIQASVSAAAAGREGSEVRFSAAGTYEMGFGHSLTMGGEGYTITFTAPLTIVFL